MTKRLQIIEDILHSMHAFRNVLRWKATRLEHHNHITHVQWFVLMQIGHARQTSTKELSENLAISSSAVTQFVDALAENGYVTRREDPNDRRLAQLKLTSKGKKHIAATKEQRIAEMANLFDAFTDRELEEYARLLKKLTSGSAKS